MQMRFRPPVSVILCILFSVHVVGQDLDVLRDTLNNGHKLKREAALLLELARKQKAENKPVIALETALKYYQITLEEEWHEQQVEGLLTLANLHNDISDYPGALEHIDKAASLSESHSLKRKLAETHLLYAKTYELMADYNLAFSHHIDALKYYELLNDKKGMSKVYQGIGIIYSMQQKYDKALEYYDRALPLAFETGDSSQIASVHNSYAVVYLRKNESKKALSHYEQVLEIHNQRKDPLNTAVTLNNIGVLYGQSGQLDTARVIFRRALKASEKIHDVRGISSAYSNLSMVAFIQGNYSKADAFQLKAIDAALRLDNYELIARAYQSLVNIQQSMGDYRSAFESQSAHLAYRDSAQQEQSASQLVALQVRFETAQKEREIELLQKEKEISTLWQRILIAGLALSLIFGSIIFYLLRQRLRKNRELYEKEQALTKAELEKVQLKEQQLESEIEMKSKQLTTHTLNMIQKNKLLEEMKIKVRDLRVPNGQMNKKISNLSRFINYSLNVDKDWEEFQLYFERVNRDFFGNIKKAHPDISPSEMRLAALIKLNMTIKEVSAVLNISPGSVKTARYRLRKKINLNTEDDLADYLMKF